jgi:hypothetical protein
MLSHFNHKPWTILIPLTTSSEHTTYGRWNRLSIGFCFVRTLGEAAVVVGAVLICAFFDQTQGLIIAAASFFTANALITLCIAARLTVDNPHALEHWSEKYLVVLSLIMCWIITPVLNGVAISLDKNAVKLLGITFAEALFATLQTGYYLWGRTYFKHSNLQKKYQPISGKQLSTSSPSFEPDIQGPLSRAYDTQTSNDVAVPVTISPAEHDIVISQAVSHWQPICSTPSSNSSFRNTIV